MHDNKGVRTHVNALKRMTLDPIYSNYFNDRRKIEVLRLIIRHEDLKFNYQVAEKNIERIKKILEKTKQMNVREVVDAYAHLYAYQTHVWVSQKKTDDVVDFLPPIQDFLWENTKLLSPQFNLVIYGNLLILRFMNGQFQEVIKMVNEILSFSSGAIRNEIIISTYVSEIIAFYELNKWDLFENRVLLLSSKIDGGSSKVWALFETLFRDVIKGNNIGEKAAKLNTQLQKQLKPRDLKTLQYLTDWLESKSTQP